MVRPAWYKADDGVWRNPRYPKGTCKQADGVDLSYDYTTNGATLTIPNDDGDSVAVALTFAEIRFLANQAHLAIHECQKENSILWKEKEAIMIREDGYEPPQYQRR